MPLPGSSISATYLFKNKLRSLNTLLKRAEYNIISERAFLFPCLAWTQQQVDSKQPSQAKLWVTLQFLLYPCLLCG
jgi:hypothetical protein